MTDSGGSADAPGRMMTQAEVRSLLKISHYQLTRLETEGKLTRIRAAGKLLYREAEVLAVEPEIRFRRTIFASRRADAAGIEEEKPAGLILEPDYRRPGGRCEYQGSCHNPARFAMKSLGDEKPVLACKSHFARILAQQTREWGTVLVQSNEGQHDEPNT